MRIRVENLMKRYLPEGTLRQSAESIRAAINNISLTIEDGETLSLVGPSGCGKSTLLKLVAGLERAESGSISYDDHDVAQVAPQDRGIGMVFQDYALYPTMKGKGNLAYFFQVHQRTEEEAEARAREIADIMGVGFDVLLGQKSTTLSGGEQQRVAIARCIVRDPTLFLMDEPICNLDAKLREQTRMEIKKLLRKFGITTLYVTHDQQEAVFMGDRIAVLREGTVSQVGSFDDLYYSPENLFVASFIGSRPMAVLPVSVENGVLHLDGVQWQLPPDVASRLPGGRLRLGVRPEDWEVLSGGGIGLRVNRLEHIPTEHLTLAHGTVAGTQITMVAPDNATDGENLAVEPVWDRVSFFAGDSEDAILIPGVPDFF